MIYNNINKKDLVFDIGANIGNRTQMFLDEGFEKVIAVEPQRSCFNILGSKFRENTRVELVPYAMADFIGKSILNIANADTISTMSEEFIEETSKRRFQGYTWDSTQVVLTSTLDVLIDEHGVPSFIKIDIEGFELTALKGLTHPVDLISIEYTPELHHSSIECMKYMETLSSYEFNFSLGESLEYSLPSFVTNEELDLWLRNNIIGKTDFNGNLLFGDIYIKRK